MTGTMELYLAPAPKKLSRRGGVFDPNHKQYMQLVGQEPQCLMPAAKQTGLDLEITLSPRVPKDQIQLRIVLDEASGIAAQGYRLAIRPKMIEITSSTPAGAFYAASTLKQIARQSGDALPCLTIDDWPDIPSRGVMLDISRDKVPTMEMLYHLVDLFAEWKMNELQLYTEHTFAYLAHPVVWEHASPMTGQQIMELDTYCRERFIELVPNQNSFGHLERWLKHPEYNGMAESPKGGNTAWGIWMQAFSLCPGDKRSLPFVEGLYDELLPHFTSDKFNVGCDETVDLGFGRSKRICKERGTGRVYLDFLMEIYRRVTERGRTMQFWGDIIIHHPELIGDLPKDIIALNWGYEANHPFATESAAFAGSGIPFYVCPGTSAWNSISGQTEKAITNMTSAARNGVGNGAIGYLNTSWGDCGHWNPNSVEYLGFLGGAMVSWNSRTDLRKCLAENLSLHALGDATFTAGRALYDLGNAYLCFGKFAFNSSIPWQLLFAPEDNKNIVSGLKLTEFDDMERRLAEAEKSFRAEQMTSPDADIVRQEVSLVLDIMRVSALVGRACLESGSSETPESLRPRIDEVKERHRQTWLLRNRPGGLEDSVARMRV